MAAVSVLSYGLVLKTKEIANLFSEQVEKALQIVGEEGVELMKAEFDKRARSQTGETRKSIMWVTSKKVGRAESDFYLERQKKGQLLIGSAYGAGKITKKGKRVSVITSIEYGHGRNKEKTALGFIRATANNPRLQEILEKRIAEQIKAMI